jgi:hypothetical protein
MEKKRKFMVIKVSFLNSLIGLKVGDIVTLVDNDISVGNDVYTFELPKHLHGRGHNAYIYNEGNYWNFDLNMLEEIEE